MFDEKFIGDNLEKVLGIQIPENKKEEVLKAMQSHIHTQMSAKIMGKLGMKDKMKIGVLMVKRNPEEIMKFLVEKIPDFPKIMREEVANFKSKAQEIINK